MKNFALIGGSGFIAPRHFKAIKDTGNNLIAVLDPFDSIGILDSFFPNVDFFVEPERFDRHLEKLKYDKKNKVDYVSICSPNYLHDAHIRLALRTGSDCICEKPLVLNPWNLDALMKIEKETGKRIWNILQLRLHPSIIKLRETVLSSPNDKIFDVDLTYLTSRGKWYYSSWKGDISKSGGIATNIGVHFFDMLSWVFGEIKNNVVNIHTHDRAAGFLEFEKARVRWFLSINYDLLPKNIKSIGQRTYRNINIDGKDLEFSHGFTDLHTKVYEQIFNGNGYSIDDVKDGISLAHEIRNQKPVGLVGDFHPYAKFKLVNHPFKVN